VQLKSFYLSQNTNTNSVLLLLLLLRPFLLHRLVLGKAQPHSLGELNVPIRAMLHTGNFVGGQRFGAKATDAIVKAAIYHIIVHAVDRPAKGKICHG
jgi:hypothetical protein